MSATAAISTSPGTAHGQHASKGVLAQVLPQSALAGAALKPPGLVAGTVAPGVTSYVLDTNVLLHDPTALFRFAEHDLYVPMAVLEELDAHKKGREDLARNAREVTRQINALIGNGKGIEKGISLAERTGGAATGKLFLWHLPGLEEGLTLQNMGLAAGKADNLILAAAQALKTQGKAVTLVSKDVNLRVKAFALSLEAQDYRNDRVLSDNDLIPPGYVEVNSTFWEENAPEGEAAFYREGSASKARVAIELPVNSFVVDIGDSSNGLWRVEHSGDGESMLHAVPTSRNKAPARKRAGRKSAVSGSDAAGPLLMPRDHFQAGALDLLHDEDIDVVSLLGTAGTGKTLLALAAGLEQTRSGRFTGVIMTRATVAVGEDIGFLPGTEEDKMNAWLGGTLEDCFDALGLFKTDKAGEKIGYMVPPEVSLRSMSFMRGRSFHRKYIIVDEAQNLTSTQMRTLLTRVGVGTKIVLTGNTAQIDTPYLDEGSSGLVWAVKLLAGWKHAGHVILPRGARSRLATHIEQAAQSKR